ncbi:solute carrier family 25 member 40 isoform X1 [Empidonax traillii]|uniref:solute carrier family 25 member 40 isoform X1 n=1 Tax=Empidonax traillii TaxID=164674 RepID=UPI000FFD67CB|nr:solute carrier family 25 member 40 isoform X1 [Empidonax traillii]XP_027754543.1 solute carrier family 25 member 40 isoform X1 [Empidonax traillii]XP_027754544.1 solute carrier family 25 member 40 isoform X1 [Empidonax traillii]XP_027754545.1 solute carrier family 25 member 40 isoform X1 [Empidonax traillii]XP_027754546.1 solute carrier family 25 member 40 isoform X1 [Empidonax traillii]
MAEMSDSNLEKPTIIQQVMASCCGAIITSLLVSPLDVIKTRLQAQSNPFPKGKCFVYSSGLMDHICVCENGDSKAWYKKPGNFKGTLDAFVKIIRIEGIKSLWSGLPPTLIMAVPNTIIYFTLYDQLHEALKYRLEKDDGYIPVLAGSLSRFSSITVVSPLELIRTRMQHRRLSYKQLYLCVSTKVAADGWFSLWKGWSSTVLRDIPFSAMYWYNYERFKKMMCNKVGAHEPTFFIAFTSGAASGSISAVITQPFDVVKTHKQTALWESETLEIPQRESTSTWAVMRKIVASNGITGLFAGVIPRLCKVAPACAIMISTYEYGKSFFSHLNEKMNQRP